MGLEQSAASDDGFTVQELAQRLGADIWAEGKPIASPVPAAILTRRLAGLATLQDATPKHLSFLANPKYTPYLAQTQAGAVLLSATAAEAFRGVALVVADPYLAYATLSHDFVRERALPAGVHETALVDPSAEIDPTAQIGPGVVIGAQVQVGPAVRIEAGTIIGDRCVLGAQTRLAPRVTLYQDVRIGAQCLIHSGAVIGADGFGFAPTPQGWLKIAQLGGVSIGDRVEIGANTCIDRGALADTVIESGVIIDNQVQIAHNCRIGEGSAIAGCVGIAGSTQVGPNCTLAGQAGLAGHISLVGGTHVGMQAQVTRSITEPGQYASGTGLWPQRQWRRLVARWRRSGGV